jgi:hypothetical protein
MKLVSVASTVTNACLNKLTKSKLFEYKKSKLIQKIVHQLTLCMLGPTCGLLLLTVVAKESTHGAMARGIWTMTKSIGLAANPTAPTATAFSPGSQTKARMRRQSRWGIAPIGNNFSAK